MSYPDVLLPRPSYRLLLPADVPAGWLLRRVKPPVSFVPSADGRPVLADPTQLCDEPAHFGNGFSVNLGGQFEPAHAGWKPTASDENTKKMNYPDWQPPTAVTPPAAHQMGYAPPADWDVLGLRLEAVHGRSFVAATFGEWQACVTHAPTHWNYWHYEVRFHNQAGQWLQEYKQHEPRLVTNRQYVLLCIGLLQSFREVGLAQPLAIVGTPARWSPALFDTAAPAQP